MGGIETGYLGETNMTTAQMKERIAESSPRFKSGITGVFYLVTIVMGGVVFFRRGRVGLVVVFIATACYIAVTALFYGLSR
jgi:hypothetical protein